MIDAIDRKRARERQRAAQPALPLPEPKPAPLKRNRKQRVVFPEPQRDAAFRKFRTAAPGTKRAAERAWQLATARALT